MRRKKPKCVVKAETFNGLNIYIPEESEDSGTQKLLAENDVEEQKAKAEKISVDENAQVRKMGLD